MNTRKPLTASEPPVSYRTYRVVIVAAFVLLLLFVVLGMAGHGPARGLVGPTDTAVSWVKEQMGYASGAVSRPVH
jgi:hypothetical protein